MPWGKPEAPAPVPGLNLRLVGQYTDYWTFNGLRRDARRNNTLYFGLMAALAL